MRLRQVALVATNLSETRTAIFKLLGLNADYADPGIGEFGLANAVMSVGDTFLEIVSPNVAGTTAGRLLERRKGDGGYMVLVQVDDIEFYRQRTETQNIRKIWEVNLDDTKAFHIHPKDIGAAIVSIDEMQPPESWRWGGPSWQTQTAAYVKNIKAVDIQAAEPETIANQWAKIFDKEVIANGAEYTIFLQDSQINFVKSADDRGDGVVAIELEAQDMNKIQQNAAQLGLTFSANTVMLCGVRFRFS